MRFIVIFVTVVCVLFHADLVTVRAANNGAVQSEMRKQVVWTTACRYHWKSVVTEQQYNTSLNVR